MKSRPDRWTVRGLIAQFLRIHDEMTDRSFAFILGAGASRPSGIPTGADLVRKWLLELQQRYDQEFDPDRLSAWANEETLGIKGFDFNKAAEFYPQIFEKRFSRDPEEGYACLEHLMSGREPSFGYSVLASILANTRHRVVITTNFDNLAADALSIYTKTYPLVCAHEDLACFIQPRLRRPLVAKIHRDLFLAPKNDVDGTSRLAQGWDRALRELLQHYAPIVVGYGGNDGSLMQLLENLQRNQLSRQIWWCYHESDGEPSERVQALISKHDGALIPIAGFDEFMLQLNETLKLQLLDNEIEQRAKERGRALPDAGRRFNEQGKDKCCKRGSARS